MSVEFYEFLNQGGEQRVIDEYYKKLRLCSSLSAVDNAAAVLIQRRWRGYCARTRIQFINGCCLKLQRVYRGHLGRVRYARAVDANVQALHQAFYQHAAITIQKHIRGYLSRKWRHSFYGRRHMICSVSSAATQLEAHIDRAHQLQVERNAIIQQDRANSLFQHLTTHSHHLISTRAIPGVYAARSVCGISVDAHLSEAAQNNQRMQAALRNKLKFTHNNTRDRVGAAALSGAQQQKQVEFDGSRRWDASSRSSLDVHHASASHSSHHSPLPSHSMHSSNYSDANSNLSSASNSRPLSGSSTHSHSHLQPLSVRGGVAPSAPSAPSSRPASAVKLQPINKQVAINNNNNSLAQTQARSFSDSPSNATTLKSPLKLPSLTSAAASSSFDEKEAQPLVAMLGAAPSSFATSVSPATTLTRSANPPHPSLSGWSQPQILQKTMKPQAHQRMY